MAVSGSFTLESVTADPPFVAEGFTQAVTLNPGASIQVTLKMWGGLTGAYTGDLVFGFDSLPPKGVSLSGKVLHSKSIAITSYPSLPEATVSSPYAAVLAASGGRPPYTWSVVGGSHLPNGLSLSSEGEISGTLDASVKTGTYAFSVKVLGSGSQGKSDTLSLTLSVAAKPTATNSLLPNCNGAYYPNLVSPLIALTDLGTGQYMGQEGGLYPGGSNVRPPVHETAGGTIASRIQPLNREGKPDPDGRYVLLGLGMSETQDDFDQFLIDAKADPSTNNHLVFANGAQDATVAADWANPTAAQWTTVLNYILPQNEVTAQQVVAAWAKDVDEPSGSFPPDEVPTQEDPESIARNLHTFFPNLQLAYFSSRIYGGYCSGDPVNSEPHSYESGFAVKWAITDQINGNSDLNFDPSAGPVVAPWMAWGPYDWANGLFTRRDGEVWTCEDFKDGIHPSNPGGRERDANQLLNFFKNDTTTIPWFLQH
jgi:Putative Ig domain